MAGHNDMFSCRGKGNCDVTEFSEANWAAKLGEEPHFVMFYAPWCGHRKQLAPKLKSAAKKLKGSGVGIAGCDVETAPAVQQMFSDIRGFPSLKYVRSGKNSAKTAIDYNGPREGDDIERWVKLRSDALCPYHSSSSPSLALFRWKPKRATRTSRGSQIWSGF